LDQPEIPLLYSISNPPTTIVNKWWILVFSFSHRFFCWHFFLVKALKNWAEIIVKLLA
jgi:hypothetical protein